MNLKLIREKPAATHVHGKMYADGEYLCDTLEDTPRNIRNREDKIVGRTAIPEGTYPVHWTKSPKFRRFLPEVVEVPWFTGIRIHAGNTHHDTAGCILVGRYYSDGMITASRTTLERVCLRISSAMARGEQVFLEVTSTATLATNALKIR